MTFVTVSSCGPHCRRGDEVRPAGPVRQAARLAALLGIVLAATAVLALPARWRRPALGACARGTLRALGIRWSLAGRLPAHRALIVANHISWLDTVLLSAAGVTCLVAKAEVRTWPLVGRIAADQGGVFLDRSRPRQLPVCVARVRDMLAAGGVVAVFPEGTTSCGEGAGGFRPAFFQAAIDAQAAVVPLTLSFAVGGVPTAQAAFIGTETLLESARRVLAMRGLTIHATIGTPIHAGPAASRRTLAGVAGTAVGPALAPVVRLRAGPPARRVAAAA
jgi:1-acyl-sn-glycerol-3-phosphate acyltransferase